MKQITDISDLRKIQIAILDNVVEFCDKHNITYFLACGSLIGALRHKGYIPWDDDIDLFMPRDQYNKLVEIYNDESGIYEMKAPNRTKEYFYTFAKVCDTRTLLIEDEVPEYKLGV
ncbi:MAG: LicD family protein, partial [Muribaculaceae bacterium]|nr:LicD family protein [Muribaculaceae bacterium]